MGFLDLLLGAVELVDAFSDHDTHFKVKCTTLELFEIGTSWKGTARIHGAGTHIKTERVDYSFTATMPCEDNSNRTKRSILRDRLRKAASETFSADGLLPKEAIILNPSESCLSCEGFVKKVDGQWKFVSTVHEAEYFGAYKLQLTKNEEIVGHDDLEYLFMAPTVAHVSSVDVHDGF